MTQDQSLSQPLRVAIVGAGQMARHHARSVQRLPNLAELVAICDPTDSARLDFLAEVPGPTGYASLTEALGQTRIDLVHIVTPPHTHESLTAQALEAGCHVYAEKPFVETVAAAEHLLGLARSRGLKVCAGHQLLFEPPSLELRRYLPVLGDLKHVESYFSFRVVKRNPDGRAPLRDDLQLIDILPHPVYLLLDLLERSGPGQTELTGLEVGPSGTVQALVRRGPLTGSLVVTIEGRPVDSYLRVVGTNGALNADFVLGTFQRNVGPGISGIDKLLSPYRRAWQLVTGTTAAMARRFLKKQRSYPGLAEIFEAFYTSIRDGTASPVSPEQILETVRICERIAEQLEAASSKPASVAPPGPAGSRVVVTGGTGFLGTEVVRLLRDSGRAVRVFARREPAGWDRIPGVEYLVVDLASPLPAAALAGVDAIIHCAAETAGGYAQHQANSIDATENLMRGAAEAGVDRFLHVSSISVMAQPSGGSLVSESSPLEANSRELGPYAWGKTLSEELASRLASELGIGLRIVRPGAFADYRRFDPPGLLGKRVGGIFVAIGSRRDPLAVADIAFSAQTLVWMLESFESAPAVLHLFDPARPTKADLVTRLRATNPDLRVIWLPMFVVTPLSWTAILLQKVLRPGKPALNIAKTFARQWYDYALISSLAAAISSRKSQVRASDSAGSTPEAATAAGAR